MNTDASISPQVGHGPDEDSRSATSEHPMLPSVCPATCVHLRASAVPIPVPTWACISTILNVYASECAMHACLCVSACSPGCLPVCVCLCVVSRAGLGALVQVSLGVQAKKVRSVC